MISNTAVPKYYGQFRDAVLRGEIPVNLEISQEMNRIDALIANPAFYYDDNAVEGWISYCENELTLTDGSDLKLLDSFKLWGEEVFGWYYYENHQVYVPGVNGQPGYYKKKTIKKRLITKQYLIVARGAAKSMYASTIQSHFLNIDTSTTEQITTAPTMAQAEEVMSPIRTAIARSRGPLFKFLTEGIKSNTRGSAADKQYLMATKKGIENKITGSLIEIRPMSVDKLQGSRAVVWTIDEWLSGDVREDIIGTAEQGASKNKEYLILCTSSEGTVRNGVGDTIKMELRKILRGEYYNPHVSIWYYKLDNINEVSDPKMWVKANPNIGKTVSYDTYQQDVIRMEHAPETRNDILAKRFGLEMEGYTYFFTYDEIQPTCINQDYWDLPCAMGADLSQGDDFCAFTFLFPIIGTTQFGVKTRNYITRTTYMNLPEALRAKYDQFIEEGTLIVMEGTILDMIDVYDDLDEFIESKHYDVVTFGYDPYNSKAFVERWERENGPFGIEKVIQGAKTESVPLGSIKHVVENRDLLFDEKLVSWTMGNCIVITDTNGNRKLYKNRKDRKIDAVAALMDAFVAYTSHKEAFD